MPGQDQHRGDHLILYDGVCGLCNGVTAFVLPRDTRHAFDFAALQSDIGRSMARKFGRHADALETFYIIVNYRTSSATLRDKASAALFLVEALGAPWAWLSVIGVLPLGWLNRAYDFVARHRYGWFGRDETCRIPSVSYQERFIDVPKT